MKYIILAAAMAARLAVAQDLLSLPPCGQRCIQNMLAKAEELGCPGADVACLCLNQDFSNGITDCTNESCLNNENKQAIIDAGIQYCADAIAQVSGGSILPTVSVTALASGISQISASRTSLVSASRTSQVSASRSSEGSASRSSEAFATTREASTVTETGAPVSTASVVVQTGTDTAGRNITSTIGALVSGGVAITTTDSRGTTFVTTATALPSEEGNSSASATGGAGRNTASRTGVPVTTTNSLGSTIVTTQTPTAGSSETPTTEEGGSATAASASPTSTGAAVRLAAAGCAGFVGMAAMVLL